MDLVLLKARFDTKWKLDETTGCWLWTASCAGKGYGQIKIPGERVQIYAHRLSYILHKGVDVEKGKHICHTCDTPKCVNPEHLFMGTNHENHMDMKNKGRSTHGEKNSQAKLTEEKVIQLHGMVKLGIPTKEIARLFGIHQSAVIRIKNGTRWERLKPS